MERDIVYHLKGGTFIWLTCPLICQLEHDNIQSEINRIIHCGFRMLSHEFVCLLPYEIYSLVYQIQPSKLRCRKSLVLREKWSPMSTDNGSMSIVNWWYDMGLFEHGIPPNSSGISPPCSMAILGYTPNFRHTHGPYHGTAGAAAEVRCRPVTTKNKGDGRRWALGLELNMHLLKFYQLFFSHYNDWFYLLMPLMHGYLL